jgi:hypothetical protein
MAMYGYDEAVYGALCYIYGDDDNKLSVQEQNGFQSYFNERHYLSHETMKTISYRWSKNSDDFYWDVINSLNDCSFTQRLEAFKTICIIINEFSSNRDDRWGPAHKIREDLGISSDEYKRYIGR